MKQDNLIIGLVENDQAFAAQTAKVLESVSGISDVYHWTTSESFWHDERSNTLDLVFLDIMLPGMNGVELAGMISERNPEIQKIMLSNMNSDELIFEALRNGAIGYILKSELKDIGDVIETVKNGGGIMTPTIAFRVLDSFKSKQARQDSEVTLTEKEKQILDLMVKGQTVNRVAAFLDVSKFTIQFHVKNIYKKLNVHNRAEMVKKAGDIGLF
jgi:DNA-binding NarL/FixJ family response regulator